MIIMAGHYYLEFSCWIIKNIGLGLVSIGTRICISFVIAVIYSTINNIPFSLSSSINSCPAH